MLGITASLWGATQASADDFVGFAWITSMMEHLNAFLPPSAMLSCGKAKGKF